MHRTAASCGRPPASCCIRTRRETDVRCNAPEYRHQVLRARLVACATYSLRGRHTGAVPRTEVVRRGRTALAILRWSSDSISSLHVVHIQRTRNLAVASAFAPRIEMLQRMVGQGCALQLYRSLPDWFGWRRFTSHCDLCILPFTPQDVRRSPVSVIIIWRLGLPGALVAQGRL